MAPKCSVPGCTSNYQSVLKAGNANYVTVFKFPSDSNLRKQWIQSIPRDNWTPTKYAVVCILHFQKEDVSYYDTSLGKNGDVQTFPRHRPILKPGAIPRLFPNLPCYLSRPKITPNRRDPEHRRYEHINKQDSAQEEWLQKDIIQSFSAFKSGLTDFIPSINSKWRVHVGEQQVVFYTLDVNVPIPKLVCSISVNEQLFVKVCVNNSIVCASDLSWVLPGRSLLSRWSQLENLLTRYVEYSENEPSNLSQIIDELTNKVNTLIDILKGDSSISDLCCPRQVEFLLEQIQLCFAKKKTYSINTIFTAFIVS